MAESKGCCEDAATACEDAATASEVRCTLSEPERKARREEIASGLATRVEAIEETTGGHVLWFRRSPELIKEVGDFIAFESGCCAFLNFELDVRASEGEFALRLTGPEGTKEFLERGIVAKVESARSR